MSRTVFIAGNWKLNLSPPQAAALATAIAKGKESHPNNDVALFPATICLPAVVSALENTGVWCGPQEVHSTNSGAFTGTTSAAVARQLGCKITLVGHSERRQYFGETSISCGLKLRNAIDSGLMAIYCVGESLSERKEGLAQKVVEAQLRDALTALELDQWSMLTIAYEPVWAIGTGETASPAQAQEMHKFIRQILSSYSEPLAKEIRIQYGGSVKPANAQELLSQPDIDGALVGGASLKAESFLGILAAL